MKTIKFVEKTATDNRVDVVEYSPKYGYKFKIIDFKLKSTTYKNAVEELYNTNLISKNIYSNLEHMINTYEKSKLEELSIHDVLNYVLLGDIKGLISTSDKYKEYSELGLEPSDYEWVLSDGILKTIKLIKYYLI